MSPKPTVLVTGCTTGSAGNALCKEFHSKGFHVFAASRRLDSMSDLKDIDDITLLSLDVTSLESIRKACGQVKAQVGEAGLDILVNNAGMAATVPALDHNMDAIRRMFETNVFGMMSMVQEFMPLLLLSKRACIVNVGSNAALVPFGFGSTYSSTKAAVHAYSDTLRVELRPLRVNVVTVILGGVKTNIFDSPPVPLPEDSYYLPIEKDFRSAKRAPKDYAQPAEIVAQRFVKAVTKSSPPRHLYVGRGSTTMSVLAWLFPLWLLDWMTARVLKIDKLSEIRAAGNS